MIQGRGSHGEIPKEKKRANSTLSVQQEKLVRFALLAIKLPEVLLFISFARPCIAVSRQAHLRGGTHVWVTCEIHEGYMRGSMRDTCGIHVSAVVRGYM
jgi:hypothetical protein